MKTPENPRNFEYPAIWELATNSYNTKAEILNQYPSDYDFFPDDDSFFIADDTTSTQLILAKNKQTSVDNPETIIVAFKGSKEFIDWIRNAIFALKKWKKPTPPSTNGEVETYEVRGKIWDHFVSFYPLILFFMGVQAFATWLDETLNNPIFDPLYDQSADPFTLHAWYLFGSGVLLLLGFVTGATIIVDKMKLYDDGNNIINTKWITLWQIMLIVGSMIIFYLITSWFMVWLVFLLVMLMLLHILGKLWADCGAPELIAPMWTLYFWYFVILILSYEFSSLNSDRISWMYFNTFSIPNFSILAILYSPLMIIIFSALLIFQPRVHYGFENSYQSIREELHGLLKEMCNEEPLKDSRIIFTGHSLGGGEAILAAIDFIHTYPKWKDNISILNFGAPRVGNIRFAYHVNRAFGRKFLRPKSGRIERIVNDLDIVARIPFKWNFYQHVGTRRRIGVTKRGGQWIKAWFSKKPAEDHGRGSYQENLENDGFI